MAYLLLVKIPFGIYNRLINIEYLYLYKFTSVVVFQYNVACISIATNGAHNQSYPLVTVPSPYRQIFLPIRSHKNSLLMWICNYTIYLPMFIMFLTSTLLQRSLHT